MLDRKSIRDQERRRTWMTLGVAFLAVVVAVVGIVVSAYYNLQAAKVEGDATLEAVEMQIQSDRALLAATPTPTSTAKVRPTPATEGLDDGDGEG